MSKRLVDVLLINADDGGRTAIADETREDVDLKRRLVPLTSDGHILVGWDSRLPSRKEILDCCLPSWNWSGRPGFHPTRHFATHFALINEFPAKPDEYNWDADQRLREFVALSRLIHLSATSFDYCARLIQRSESRWDIIPANNPSSAYTGNPRSFLRLSEWKATATLVEKWRVLRVRPRIAKGRVATAIWWREKAAQEFYAEVRWQHLVTSIESLIKIWGKHSKLRSTDNFVRGMRMLAKAIKRPFTQREARKAYETRSTHTHGGRWPVNFPRLNSVRRRRPTMFQNDQRRLKLQELLYNKVEGILDGAIRKAIEDDAFGGVFLNNGLLLSELQHAI